MAKISLTIAIQWKSRTFLEYRTETNRIASNRTESNRTESNSTELVRICSFEPNRIFSIFRWFYGFDRIHHVKSFKCNKTEFGSIEKTSKYWKSSREPMFNSVRFVSVSEKSSVSEFHCIRKGWIIHSCKYDDKNCLLVIIFLWSFHSYLGFLINLKYLWIYISFTFKGCWN